MTQKANFMAVLIFVALIFVPALGLISPDRFSDPIRKLDLGVADTKWDFFEADDITSQTTQSDLELQFVARAPQVTDKKTQPTLTLRIDKKEVDTARKYSARWLKEFPKFGYELQSSQDAKYGALEGFDMELLSTLSDRRVRQFVVARPQEMWVFTCSSDEKHFQEAWKACAKILNTAKIR